MSLFKKNILTKIIKKDNNSHLCFVFNTNKFDLALKTLNTYQLLHSMLGLDVFRGLDVVTRLPLNNNYCIRMEWAFEDPDPMHSYALNFDYEEVEEYQKINQKSNNT